MKQRQLSTSSSRIEYIARQPAAPSGYQVMDDGDIYCLYRLYRRLQTNLLGQRYKINVDISDVSRRYIYDFKARIRLRLKVFRSLFCSPKQHKKKTVSHTH